MKKWNQQGAVNAKPDFIMKKVASTMETSTIKGGDAKRLYKDFMAAFFLEPRLVPPGLEKMVRKHLGCLRTTGWRDGNFFFFWILVVLRLGMGGGSAQKYDQYKNKCKTPKCLCFSTMGCRRKLIACLAMFIYIDHGELF